jgi:FkbM family methyltransferase
MKSDYQSRKISDLLHFSASILRKLPYIPGKVRVSRLLNGVLTGHCGVGLVRFQTKRGLSMKIDLRSKAEWRSYWTGKYDDEEIDTLLDLVDRRGDVLDVGAQVGFYTLAFAEELVSGTVHAFEPVRSNAQRLRENVEENRKEEVVDVYQIALGDRKKRAHVEVEGEGGSTTGNAFQVRGKVEEFAEGTETVEYTPLDSVAEIDPENCRLIKVDIEGGEVDFLKGAEKFIRKGRPYIYGEFNAFWLEMYGQDFDEVVSLCEEWGYEVFEIEKGKVRKVQSPGKGTEDVLLIPEEKEERLTSLSR